jgi:hypothetical protein
VITGVRLGFEVAYFQLIRGYLLCICLVFECQAKKLKSGIFAPIALPSTKIAGCGIPVARPGFHSNFKR